MGGDAQLEEEINRLQNGVSVVFDVISTIPITCNEKKKGKFMNQTKSLISNNKIKNAFEFIFEHGGYKGKKYTAILHVTCDNPTCSCCDMVITVQNSEEQNIGIDNMEYYQFGIDVENKKISKSNNRDISRQNLNFAKAFINELTDKEWKFFYQYLYAYKYKLTVDCDIDNLDLSFDHKSIEGGSMLGFSLIFPYAEQFSFNYNDSEYFIDDQYCLCSICNCTNSAITFVILTGKKTIGGKKSPVVLYNYESNSFQIENHGLASKDEIYSLVEELKKSYMDLKVILKKRHRILRTIYLNYRKKNNLKDTSIKTQDKSINIDNIQIGRNDPCHCGSGKKFKKCCG